MWRSFLSGRRHPPKGLATIEENTAIVVINDYIKEINSLSGSLELRSNRTACSILINPVQKRQNAGYNTLRFILFMIKWYDITGFLLDTFNNPQGFIRLGREGALSRKEYICCPGSKQALLASEYLVLQFWTLLQYVTGVGGKGRGPPAPITF